jgi:hypothetical protein
MALRRLTRRSPLVRAIGAVALAALTLCTGVPSQSPGVSRNKPDNSDSRSTATQEKRFVDAFRKPIAFYGRVVDQYGNAVGQADVKMAANDKPLGGRPSEYVRKSDNGGLFSITGIVGLTLAVEVSKPGYLVIPPADKKVTSSGLFEYGLSSVRGPHRPSEGEPVIFTLYKPGTPEPIEKVGKKNFRIARDGSPLSISLDQGQAHQVILRCWNTDASRPQGQHQYDWRLEITVLGGGLIHRAGSFDFEAPKDGYANSDTIEMLASLPAANWDSMAERAYFIRFADGVFARASLEMHAGGDRFVVWESFLNPKAGSRILEGNLQ